MKTKRYIFILLFPVALEAQTKLSLQECREMASANDPYIRNARLDVLAARAQKQEALSEYFPTVSVNAFGFMALDPMVEIGMKDILGDNALGNGVQNLINDIGPFFGIPPVYSTLKYGYTATVSLVQPIYAGGRIVNGNRLAALGVEAAGLQEKVKTRDNSEKVAAGYWQVLMLEEKMTTLEQLAELTDTLYKDVSGAVAAGLAVGTDLMQVQLKRNELRNGIVQLRGGIRLAKMNLCNTIGQDYCVVRTVADSLHPYIDDIVLTDSIDVPEEPQRYYRPEEEIVAGLDEIRLLDMSVESKRLEKKMILGEALPSIGVGAGYGYSRAVNSRFNGAVFAMVRIPVSDWGKVVRKVQKQEFQMQKAENDREYLSAQLTLQIRQLWLDLTTAWDQVAVAQESMDLARKNADQLADSYKAGLIPLAELMQARSQLQECSEAYFDRCADYLLALSAYCSRL